MEAPKQETPASSDSAGGGAPANSSAVSLEQLRVKLADFAAERHWEQYHTPRNLLLALVGEVGELSEIFQWRGEVLPGLPGFTPAERAHVGQELADVLLYLVRLADICAIDLGQAALDKLAHNAAKYPVQRCRGSSAKYTAYGQSEQQQQQEGEEQQHDRQKQQQQQRQQEQGQQHARQQRNGQQQGASSPGGGGRAQERRADAARDGGDASGPDKPGGTQS